MFYFVEARMIILLPRCVSNTLFFGDYGDFSHYTRQFIVLIRSTVCVIMLLHLLFLRHLQ